MMRCNASTERMLQATAQHHSTQRTTTPAMQMAAAAIPRGRANRTGKRQMRPSHTLDKAYTN